VLRGIEIVHKLPNKENNAFKKKSKKAMNTHKRSQE
jgi:hypothetical protein